MIGRYAEGHPDEELTQLISSVQVFLAVAHSATGTLRRAALASLSFQTDVVTGAAAGNFVVDGIAIGDRILSVIRHIGAGVAVTDVTDITSQFAVTAPNRITNTGGTNTTGDKLVVTWLDLT